MTDNLESQYDPSEVEEVVRNVWETSNAYEYVKQKRTDEEPFYFLDGPPFTSGQMHLGTAWNKILKDTLVRYKRMQGYNVLDRPGYDMHGLPIETKVEEEFDFDNKKDIEEYGAHEFIRECREFALSNKEKMDEDFKSLGVWMDWDNAYQTLDPEYMETVWWAFNKAHRRGHVEKQEHVVNVCPRCETALADAEVEYEEVTSTAAYVLFELKDAEGKLVTWTTTPWTVPANQFVALDEESTYAAVRTEGGELLYLASACVEETMGSVGVEEYEVERTMDGNELVGLTYEHPLRDLLPNHPTLEGKTVHAEYVGLEKTGLVHSAPGHGYEDYQRGRDLNLPMFSPVSQDGTFTSEVAPYEGMFVREANSEVLEDLEERGTLLHSNEHEHNYGHCPRCDTGIVFRAAEHWVVDLDSVKEKLLDNIEKTSWNPSEARDSRFRNFVEGSTEWTLSRQRYWGTPIPIWTCGSCDENVVVGSRNELQELAGLDSVPEDLHRPTVDNLSWSCDCGGVFERVEDVFDVWFDSAAASWASLDFPSKHSSVPSEWPADLIVEAHDQTRGWFWSQLCLGTVTVDRAPYTDVVMHGFAQLEGDKMSKSRGNVVTPETAIEKVGRDPLRAYLLQTSPKNTDMNVEWDGLETTRDELNVIWNVYRFALQYMSLDDYEPTPEWQDVGNQNAVDKWVLSRLSSTATEVEEEMEEYNTHHALDELQTFLVKDVSRYYVQTVRDRVWSDEMTESKKAAYDTLGTVLYASAKMLAPFAPFLAERLYGALAGEEQTVHAEDWPSVDDSFVDKTLEEHMETVREVESAVSKARQEAGIKHRWPLSEVQVEANNDTAAAAVRLHESLLEERTNVKDVNVTDDSPTVERVVPEMSVLGPEFGSDAQEIADRVRGLSKEEYDGTVELDDKVVSLSEDAVTFQRDTVGEEIYEVEFEEGAVYVDSDLDDSLQQEGYMRDIVRRVQEMRRTVGTELDDYIDVAVTGNEELVEAVKQHEDHFKRETRTAEVRYTLQPDWHAESWSVDGREVTVAVCLHQNPLGRT